MRAQPLPASAPATETALAPLAAKPSGWQGVADVLGIPGGALVLEGRARAAEAEAEAFHVHDALEHAVDCLRLRAVLRLAGAPDTSSSAAQQLRECAAAAVARRLQQASQSGAGWPMPAPPVTPDLLAAARRATSRPGVQLAMHLAGLTAGSLPADSVQHALAMELAATAWQAALLGRAENPPTPEACVALGSERAAQEAEASPAMA